MAGLLRGMARTAAIAGTANAVTHRQNQRWASKATQQQYEEQQQYVQAQPATPAQDDTVTQLQQLAQLKEQGILTQEEFDTKKKQILGL